MVKTIKKYRKKRKTYRAKNKINKRSTRRFQKGGATAKFTTILDPNNQNEKCVTQIDFTSQFVFGKAQFQIPSNTLNLPLCVGSFFVTKDDRQMSNISNLTRNISDNTSNAIRFGINSMMNIKRNARGQDAKEGEYNKNKFNLIFGQITNIDDSKGNGIVYIQYQPMRIAQSIEDIPFASDVGKNKIMASNRVKKIGNVYNKYRQQGGEEQLNGSCFKNLNLNKLDVNQFGSYNIDYSAVPIEFPILLIPENKILGSKTEVDVGYSGLFDITFWSHLRVLNPNEILNPEPNDQIQVIAMSSINNKGIKEETKYAIKSSDDDVTFNDIKYKNTKFLDALNEYLNSENNNLSDINKNFSASSPQTINGIPMPTRSLPPPPGAASSSGPPPRPPPPPGAPPSRSSSLPHP